MIKEKRDRRRKLTDEQIYIIQRLKGSIPAVKVAEMYDVSVTTITNIFEPERYALRKKKCAQYKSRNEENARYNKRKYAQRIMYKIEDPDILEANQVWETLQGIRIILLWGGRRFEYFDAQGQNRTKDLQLSKLIYKPVSLKGAIEWLR